MARINEIRYDLNQLQQEATELAAAIAKESSSKRLEIFSKGNSSRWYVFENGQRKYLPKKQRKEASKLARQAWRRARLTEVEAEIEACCSYLKKVDGCSREMEKLLAKPGIDTLIGSSHSAVESWVKECFAKNPNHPETLKFHTPSGVLVRSKSEVLIAMTLDKYGVPFRYECPLETNSGTFYPDFTILNPADRRLYIWEHFGLMDDVAYTSNFASKINTYIQLGYFPDDNLLMTFESAERPLDPDAIEKLVLRKFAPKI